MIYFKLFLSSFYEESHNNQITSQPYTQEREIHEYCILGCSDFLTFKMTLIQYCQIVVGSQFQNFMSICCLFPWVQGLRKLGVLP